ncbi:MAG: hypothetical protein Q8S33_34410 [Myxococcales bacterium]|nr:hypothetical protein [Myxococcales bacterium]
MPRIHVESRIQFNPELYRKSDRTAWFTEVGKELEKRKLTLTLAPGVTVKNADELVALMKQYASDKTGLQAKLNLPATTTLANYVQDLVQAIDDMVKSSSHVTDALIDVSPSGDYAKLLGLDTNARYASTNTRMGRGSVDEVAKVGAIEVSRTAGTADPLQGKLFMDSTTFAGMPSNGWNRDGVEIEVVNGVRGVSGKELLNTLRETNAAGRSVFSRLRRPEISEAYTIGYRGVSVDEIRWDGDAHRLREANKFVSLTLEGGRFEAPTPGAPREISVGTDKMDDVYYDTKDFGLLDADLSVRGRARWDTDTQIRRLLVAVKGNTTVDEFGLKHAAKVDVRTDSATAEDIANLDRDVRVGSSRWSGLLSPLKGVYDSLNEKGVLPDIGGRTGVLMLEPKVHIRSVRSRYHLNETSLQAMTEFYAQTSGKLDRAVALATAAQPRVTGGDRRTVEELLSAAAGIKDGTAIARLAEAELKRLDPTMQVTADTVKALMPTTSQVSWNRPSNDLLSIEKKRVVAAAVDQAYHAFAEQLDGARRIITESQDRTFENHPPLVMAWMKSTDPSLVNKKTYDEFLTRYDALLARPQAEQDAGLQAFNTFGEAQRAAGNRDFRRFRPLDAAGFKALRPQLLNEVVRVDQRQLEAAGSMAQALWYDEARAFYIPEARRNTGNLFIDTMDMTEAVKHEDWQSIPENERTPAHQLPVDKVFDSMLVNEVQIELGSEKAYVDRLEALSATLKGDRASLVMKWFDSTSRPGVDPATPASYAAALKVLLAQPASQRDADLSALNDFAKTQGSPVTVTAADMTPLAAPDFQGFTAANRDRAVRTTPDVERNLAGARFVFDQILNAQKLISSSKEERVVRVLEDAGLSGVTWGATDDSKGNLALKGVRGGQP